MGLVLAMACLAAPLLAQEPDYTHIIARMHRVELVSHHPACNPFAMAFDPLTFGGRGIHAPRIVFHEGYALLNTGIESSLHALHAPPWITRPVVRFGLPLTPHLLQAARGLTGHGVYQLNLYDWFYDFTGKQPLALTRRNLAVHALNGVGLSCFARP